MNQSMRHQYTIRVHAADKNGIFMDGTYGIQAVAEPEDLPDEIINAAQEVVNMPDANETEWWRTVCKVAMLAQVTDYS